MCRMFAYVGSSNKEIAKLHEALRESARKDTVVEQIKKNNGLTLTKSSCEDGWGYTVFSANDIFFYKTDKPIFEDQNKIPEINGKSYVIAHARKASDRKKLGVSFAHPFVSISDGNVVFLAHNGLVDMPENPKISDTEYVLKVISEKSLNRGIDELKPHTISGLNLVILEIEKPSNVPSLKFLNFYTPRLDRDASLYFDLYALKKNNSAAVVSSTLLDYGIEVDGKVPYGQICNLERF